MGDLASGNGNAPRTVSVEEAARFLGISKSAYYHAIRINAVPFIRIGRTIRVPVAQLERWIESQGPLR